MSPIRKGESKFSRSIFWEVLDGCIKVETTTASTGFGNSWKLGPCESDTKYDSFKVYSQICCMTNGKYDLTCKDSYGDGWSKKDATFGLMSGFIMIQNNRYCENFFSGSQQTYSVSITTGNQQIKQMIDKMILFIF